MSNLSLAGIPDFIKTLHHGHHPNVHLFFKNQPKPLKTGKTVKVRCKPGLPKFVCLTEAIFLLKKINDYF